ncbi:MAG: phosphate signaling complex protein PhoU [Acetobacteraceae bacterium]|nr:phosphate signaling complex protein PhoU [Acetobacteraceae bacterium]
MSEAPQHIVKSFSQELQRLRDLLAEMGGIVESQLALATQAIVGQDPDMATRAVQQDSAVDTLERQVEQLVMRMLALRQPMASDLRQIVAALKISAGLERIGDYAKNVAKRSIVLTQFALPFSLTGLGSMARLAQENLRLVIDAVGENDPDKAVQVWRSDQGIDDLYNSIFRELITYMMEDARSITPCTHLLFIAKNLERIGDHATNIAETVYYAATGTVLTDERPRGGDGGAFAAVRPKEASAE